MVSIAEWFKRWGLPFVLTVVVLVIAGAIAWPQVVNCWDTWTTWPTLAERYFAVLKPPSACLAPNEIGDFLAGVFAPLAFIWLSWAVVLQSQELRAQRDDNALSREVAKDQRAAMQAQATEAKATAEALQAQAEAMKLERELRDQEAARVEFALAGC
jgi:hypothetical protein